MSFSENELFVSDHELVPGQRQRPTYWGRVSNEPRKKGKEQDCSTNAALLESAALLGKLIPRISADNERFYPDISKGSECSDLVLWACFHQPFGAGYVKCYVENTLVHIH